jgi:hypothetical protein
MVSSNFGLYGVSNAAAIVSSNLYLQANSVYVCQNNIFNVTGMTNALELTTSTPPARLTGALHSWLYAQGILNSIGTWNGGSGATADMSFQLNGVEYMHASSGGNVGIGISNPEYKLDVIGVVKAGNGLFIPGSTTVNNQGTWIAWNRDYASGQTWYMNQKGNGLGGHIFGEVTIANAFTEYMRLTGTGNLGIGVTNPGVQLDLSTDGARKLTTSTCATGSDSRVKNNIEDANLDMCYSNLKSINLKRFQWNSNLYPEVDDRNTLGWIAQEVKEIYPKAVYETESFGFSNFLNLNSDIILKTVYGALRKTINIIESQAITISNLESRIIQLESR